MKFDLIRPCKHCPFRNDETRITFASRERAEEIEEIAYRQGFVCHEHGEDIETDEDSHIDFREDGTSQHCFGALFMYLRHGSGNVPWENYTDEDESREAAWWDRLTAKQLNDAHLLVWESEDEFFEANDTQNVTPITDT